MANVSDFSIVLDGEATVSTGNVFTRTFNTERVLRGGEKAVLIFNIRNLQSSVSVLINGQNIGQLRGDASGVTTGVVLSQTLIFRSAVLKGGSAPNANTIEIAASSPSDSFTLKDIVCFFRQSTGD